MLIGLDSLLIDYQVNSYGFRGGQILYQANATKIGLGSKYTVDLCFICIMCINMNMHLHKTGWKEEVHVFRCVSAVSVVCVHVCVSRSLLCRWTCIICADA